VFLNSTSISSSSDDAMKSKAWLDLAEVKADPMDRSDFRTARQKTSRRMRIMRWQINFSIWHASSRLLFHINISQSGDSRGNPHKQKPTSGAWDEARGCQGNFHPVHWTRSHCPRWPINHLSCSGEFSKISKFNSF
jgi:hypothetical protein